MILFRLAYFSIKSIRTRKTEGMMNRRDFMKGSLLSGAAAGLVARAPAKRSEFPPVIELPSGASGRERGLSS